MKYFISYTLLRTGVNYFSNKIIEVENAINTIEDIRSLEKTLARDLTETFIDPKFKFTSSYVSIVNFIKL